MACSNNRYQKSSCTMINSAAQAFVAAGTTLDAGSSVFTSGCSLAAGDNGVAIRSEGLYTATVAVTFTPSGTGAVTIAAYLGTLLLPCSLRQLSVTSGSIYTVEVTVPVFSATACRMVQPELAVQISGEPGSVSWMCENVTKIA